VATKKPLTLADLVSRVRSGVLRIETNLCDGSGQGSGFLISPRLVVTVEHVIDGESAITLKRNGQVLSSATVIGSDADSDVALLRSDAPLTGFNFRLAPRSPRLGEDVAAIGFPLGLPLSVNRGSVSGSNRTVKIGGIKREGLIQTDAALNPGNSGGPLISIADGHVVGLVDLKNVDASGVGFAVSAEVARPLIDAWSLAPQVESPADCAPAASAAGSNQPGTSGAVGQIDGRYFTMTYPSFWNVDTREVERGSYLDTTVTNTNDPSILVRVDVTPNLTGDILSAAETVRSALRKQAGYREVSYTKTTFFGYPAVRWEFITVEHGIDIHKVDRFFLSDKGDGFAILTQAPEHEFAAYEQPLDAIAGTVTPK
jgi:hypothetical protein